MSQSESNQEKVNPVTNLDDIAREDELAEQDPQTNPASGPEQEEVKEEEGDSEGGSSANRMILDDRGNPISQAEYRRRRQGRPSRAAESATGGSPTEATQPRETGNETRSQLSGEGGREASPREGETSTPAAAARPLGGVAAQTAQFRRQSNRGGPSIPQIRPPKLEELSSLRRTPLAQFLSRFDKAQSRADSIAYPPLEIA
eukprot:snap_masked-scaffold_7-processed-gene-19.43-mRNA-1 protein AED:1.00 eAED:1.00 QI:0/-1/0/0/-1/1/1/0/201